MTKMKKYTKIKDYIADCPKEVQNALKQMQLIIKKAAPGAEETMSYGMPTYKLHGKYLVYFAGWKNHIGFYPIPSAVKAFATEFSKYKSSKGTVQFPLDKPLPKSLISKVVKFRAKENLLYAQSKKSKS